MRLELKKPRSTPAEVSQEIRDTVSEILLAVEHEGLPAVRRYSQRFDGWSPATFRVSPAEFTAAGDAIDPTLRRHIDIAHEQVRRFAEVQRDSLHDVECETLPGVTLGHRHVPVAAVGSYSPGGRYPLIASSLMTVAVPKVAGVRRVVACAPPRDGAGIYPPMLYAMASAGVDEVLCVGGVQALAALAYGVEDVEPVDMLVGAGNAYVAEAKRQLFGRVGIDLLAGPTEILIIADETAEPELLAADLLGQAEHGPTSVCWLLTSSEEVGRATLAAVDRLLESWPTADVARRSWAGFGCVTVCEDDEDLAALADELAPEHLEVQTRDPAWFHDRLVNYGSLFLGREATVAYGDKGIGTNHVLPTERAARYTGGLWVGKFLKTLTYQRVTAEGTAAIAPTISAVARGELMDGHAITAEVRLDGVAGTVHAG